ncbi:MULTISPECIES: hypothetical protein [unclassified Pseudomonas]|uniref:Uncharacterized protein n=1 Tax=Pseudomonas sp. MYb327 TaxID=2745230 RepID=A0AAU8E749_9PSED
MYLFLDVPFQRLTDYQENGDFLAKTVNRDFDRIWLALKQLLRSDTRALTLGPNDVDGAGAYLANNNRIANLGDPIHDTDAANLSSVAVLVAAEAAFRQAADAILQGQITGAAGLVASQFSPLSWHDQVIPSSVTIPPNKNAWSFGPTMTIALGQAVTIGAGSFWTIANGATTGAGTLNTELPDPLDLNL